jgi:hypothetical protein
MEGQANPPTDQSQEPYFMRARSVLFLVIILIAVFMPDLILGFVGEFLNQFKDAIHQATAR